MPLPDDRGAAFAVAIADTVPLFFWQRWSTSKASSRIRQPEKGRVGNT